MPSTRVFAPWKIEYIGFSDKKLAINLNSISKQVQVKHFSKKIDR